MASAGVDILEMLPDATAEVSGTFFKKKLTKTCLYIHFYYNYIFLLLNFLLFVYKSAHATSLVLIAASVWSVRTVCASVPQGSASVYPMSLA